MHARLFRLSVDESKETIMIICNCKAPGGFVHVSCLEKRLLDEDITRCEVCNYTFEIKRTDMPILQVFTQIKDSAVIKRYIIGNDINSKIKICS